MEKIYSLSEVAHMMSGKPPTQKIKTLRDTMANFLKFVYHSGYTFDEPNRSLRDFIKKDECGTEAATNLIKTVWVLVNAETIAKEEAKRN